MVRVIVEADGGSRGNPGVAGSGTIVLSADKKVVLARIAEYVGSATNNVAEYRALRNGLLAAQAYGADAVDVLMDSKLVVEQMNGRWKIKHPDMRELALECRDVAARIGTVTYTWVPRKDNSRADELANKAMDAGADGSAIGYLPGYSIDDVAAHGAESDTESSSASGKGSLAPEQPLAADTAGAAQTSGVGDVAVSKETPAHVMSWSTMNPTRLFLVRHGQTEHSRCQVYSGKQSNPPLTELGHAQAEALGRRLRGEGIDHIVASPQLRAQQTAHHIAQALGVEVDTLDSLCELDFGAWEGLSFAQAHAADEEIHSKWLSDTQVAPPGGESLQAAFRRVKKALGHIIDTYGESNVVVVSHVTPIKSILRVALDAGPSLYHRLHLDLACLSIAEFYADGPKSVRVIGEVPSREATQE